MSDFDIFDCHQHFGNISDAIPGAFAERETMSDEEFSRKELETRLSILEKQEIKEAVIIGGHVYVHPDGIADTRRVNDGVAAYRDHLPERFPVAVGIVEPMYGERGFQEIDRCKQELGMVGISFHTRFQGVSVDTPWVRRYLERMGEVGLIPWVHAVGDSVEESLWKVDVLAEDFPDLPFLVLDVFTNFENPSLAVKVAERRPNVSFDTSLSYSFDLMRPLIARCGAERILFGSDLYSWPLGTKGSHILPEILESDLTDSDKKKILGDNLRTVLGMS